MSNTSVQAYLNFDGCCEEALEFYKSAVGAEVEMMMRFSDSPEPLPPGMVPEGYDNKIMHATFKVGETALMASDGSEEGTGFQGITLSISVETAAETDPIFTALSVGGQVGMPLDKTFWSPRFGMLTDKFGVSWMVSART